MRLLFIALCCLLASTDNAQTETTSDIEQIRETLMNYIDGTANGDIDKLNKAFHPDFNLYSVNANDSLEVWSGQGYIGKITPGQKSNRIGRIISIDHENNAASAKAEILIPNWRIFTDYFLLLKYQGE